MQRLSAAQQRMLQLLDEGPAHEMSVRERGSNQAGRAKQDLAWMMDAPFDGEPFIERREEDGLLQQTERGKVLSLALDHRPVQTSLLRLMKAGRGYRPMEFHYRRNFPAPHVLQAFAQFATAGITEPVTVDGVEYVRLTAHGEKVKAHIPDE